MTIPELFQIYANLHKGEIHTHAEIIAEISKMSGDRFSPTSIIPADYCDNSYEKRTAKKRSPLVLHRLQRQIYRIM